MISCVVVLKHENTNNLNDLMIDVTADTYAEIADAVNKFILEYNAAQLARDPPEPTIFDWILADREDLDGLSAELIYGKEEENEHDEE